VILDEASNSSKARLRPERSGKVSSVLIITLLFPDLLFLELGQQFRIFDHSRPCTVRSMHCAAIQNNIPQKLELINGMVKGGLDKKRGL
jgi:hypothetical protein